MKLENQTIFIVSNEPWGDIWYSKHNWAYELSKNNKVIFLNPPQKWTIYSIFNLKFNFFNFNKNLVIFNYKNFIPYTRFSVVAYINDYLFLIYFKKWLKKNGINNSIFWTFDPFRFSNPKIFKSIISIYFIADLYRIKKEIKLIKNVDYVFSISKEITDFLKINKPLILSHSISENEFEESINQVELKDYILYIGGIDYRLDFYLINELVSFFQSQTFLFIGPILNNEDTYFIDLFIKKKYKNLIYKKPVPYFQLKNFISNSKICIAPMKVDSLGNTLNSHKILSYLAQDKPVICPPFKDYKNSDVLFVYNNFSEAKNLFIEILMRKENELKDIKRINFAQKFLFKNQIKKIENFLNEDLKCT